MIRVEVAFARPDRQEIIGLNVEEGTTAVEAVKRSGIAAVFPEVDPENDDMGIFGKVIKNPSAHELRDGDPTGRLKSTPSRPGSTGQRRRADESSVGGGFFQQLCLVI